MEPRKIWLLGILCLSVNYTECQKLREDWTALYSFFYSAQEKMQQKNQSKIELVKTHVQKFNQLLFSWNAHKPVQGFFTFWIRARDAETKQWYPWHKMMEWGAGVQQSFLDPKQSSPNSTQYAHVRLELPSKRFADGFRCRIMSHDGADLSLLEHIFFNTINLQQFRPELASDYKYLDSQMIYDVPRWSQMQLPHYDAQRLCSPTSVAMLLSYLNKKEHLPLTMSAHVHDKGLDSYGSWPFNTAAVFALSRGSIACHVERLSSFQDLYNHLEKKVPVVVSVRSLKGGASSYAQGHLLVVVGYNKEGQRVVCHDPAFEDDDKTFVTYPLKDFLAAWELSRRLAYVAQV